MPIGATRRRDRAAATVPVGRYTQQALQAANLWDPLAAKFVQADSVRQVLDYVARGEVDAGFVYRTDAKQLADKVDADCFLLLRHILAAF